MSRQGYRVAVWYDETGGTPVDLSTDTDDIGDLPLTYDEIPREGYQQDHRWLNGMGDCSITITFRFVAGSDTVHSIFSAQVGLNTAKTLTLQFGDNAAPVATNPEFEGEFIVSAYTVSAPRDGLQTAVVKFAVGDGALPAWGTMA